VGEASNVPVELRGAVILLGNFDGFHVGHHALLTAARAIAAETKAKLGIMSCEPHPRQFFMSPSPPFRITTRRTKLRGSEARSFDLAYMPCFDGTSAALSPELFASEILREGLGASHVVCGADFRFGFRRRGDANLLRELGLHLGFGVTVVAEVKIGGMRVSSTSIRRAIQAGLVAEANFILGEPWATPLYVNERPRLTLDPSLVLPSPGTYTIRLVADGSRSEPRKIFIENNEAFPLEPLALPVGEYLAEWIG
jgi:riboflavin kinase/FMN adenylyltransferase